MLSLPEEFKNRTQAILKEEYDLFVKALATPCKTSIRLNPEKKKPNLNLTQAIPWCSRGFYLDQKPIFTLDPFFHAGHYYVQEPSSMILEEIMKNIEIPAHAKVLDLCAAPGGKSTHLLSLLPSDAIVHCHEINSLRAEILRQNIEKWGYPNTLVSTGSIDKIVKSGIKYDLVLIDAPCSGEGMFRKEVEAIKQWSTNKINHCVSLQNDITKNLHLLLKNNSYLIYSTCTYNFEENENVMQRLTSNNDFESIPIQENNQTNLFHTTNKSIHTYRCLPHRMEGEGFTFSLLKYKSTENNVIKNKFSGSNATKKQSPLLDYIQNNQLYQTLTYNYLEYAIPNAHSAFYGAMTTTGLKILSMGIPLGHFKGKDWFPEHGLSKSTILSLSIAKIDLELSEALHYLRADNSYLPAPISNEVWQIITYQDASLGWTKRIDQKLKNYLPKNERIHSL